MYFPFADTSTAATPFGCGEKYVLTGEQDFESHTTIIESGPGACELIDLGMACAWQLRTCIRCHEPPFIG